MRTTRATTFAFLWATMSTVSRRATRPRTSKTCSRRWTTRRTLSRTLRVSRASTTGTWRCLANHHTTPPTLRSARSAPTPSSRRRRSARSSRRPLPPLRPPSQSLPRSRGRRRPRRSATLLSSSLVRVCKRLAWPASCSSPRRRRRCSTWPLRCWGTRSSTSALRAHRRSSTPRSTRSRPSLYARSLQWRLRRKMRPKCSRR
mmetsp:Transcript_10209/g.20812  ORF Transcript_10209/g.20812 Transcript_10209/m.20812 type:complete len:202 (-) Transcript_10209:802-1407(-)